MPSLRSNIPVKLGLISCVTSVETAVQAETETRFNTLCNKGHDATRVQQKLTCPTCSSEDKSAFVKGKEVGKGEYVIVTAEAMKAAEVPDALRNSIEVTTHPAADLVGKTLPGGKVYFLVPGKGAGDTYPLLVEVVRNKTDVAFVTVFAVRGKPAMYQLGTFGDVLTITELAWPGMVKAVRGSDEELNDAMVPLAEQFVDQLLTPFDPTTYRDTRAETLAQFIANAEGVAGAAPATAAPAPDASNALLAALQAAVDAKPKATKPKKKKEAA